ncbi:uncharacterized protein NPIL_555202 [Nephila pilipes]|uniref:Uncharacterized protein n=1 Tax=Nephila pilipes TaxID=299642 RepID=A0A8X6P8S9_NEPPI|nr:uncharacterized protein NPIL_555202 [Nephila pilipes]
MTVASTYSTIFKNGKVFQLIVCLSLRVFVQKNEKNYFLSPTFKHGSQIQIQQKVTRKILDFNSGCKMESTSKRKQGHEQELFNQGQIEETSFDALTVELTNLSSELHLKLNKLEAIVKKMKEIPQKLKAIRELSELQQSIDSSFETRVSRFSEAADELQQMYRKEFIIKSSICKEICVFTKESELIFFEAYWKYEPNIDREKVDELLKGILYELEINHQL